MNRQAALLWMGFGVGLSMGAAVSGFIISLLNPSSFNSPLLIPVVVGLEICAWTWWKLKKGGGARLNVKEDKA